MNYRFAGVVPVLAGLALALSVFACGGGDDSSTQAPPTRSQLISNAAEAIPVAGSVSQGSRRQGLATLDRVTWNGRGGSEITVRVGSVEAQTAPGDDTSDILEDSNSPAGVVTLVTDPNSGSANFAIVQVVSDVSYTATSGEFTPAFSVASNPNLVFGIWATATAGGNITAIGAFADGTETPSDAVPTSGTYTGNLFAFYHDIDDNEEVGSNYSVASITLTVADDGSVSGTVSGIADKGSSDSFRFIDSRDEGAFSIALESATPSTTDDGGFFQSPTSLRLGGQTIPSSRGTSTGRWGGQFFGDSGQNIAGTIGVNWLYPPGEGGGSFTVFGSFSATRQP